MVAPLAITVGIVLVLADPAHIDVNELRSNSYLMDAHPFFRVVAPADEVRVAFGNSAILLSVAMLGAIALGLPSGIAYAWSTNRVIRAIAWSIATFASSLPAFFWAVVLELALIAMYLRFGFRPLPIAGFGVDSHLVLPALALGLRPAAYIFRLTAVAIENAKHADYVRTATAKGLRDRLILTRHVFPNAAPQIISALVVATRGALSSLLIIEFVYIWGGAGTLFVQVLAQRRLELAAELALAFALTSAVLGILADAARARIPQQP